MTVFEFIEELPNFLSDLLNEFEAYCIKECGIDYHMFGEDWFNTLIEFIRNHKC